MRISEYITISIFCIFSVNINSVFATTSGPTQPEVQQFTPIDASSVVNIFSGNFSYNIPLFELPGPNGGYPFNIGYSSGIGMDMEATWVGLGWNLHVGSINRQMRTLPDEFNGTEKLIKKVDQLDNKTVGMGLNFSAEYTGIDPKEIVSIAPSYGVSMYYNTYKGFGFSTDLGVGVTFGKTTGMTGGIGINVKNDNQEGTTFSPNLSLGYTASAKSANIGGSLNLGLNYNSNMGLQNISLGGGMSVSGGKEHFKNKADRDMIGPRQNSTEKKSGSSASVSSSASMSFNNSFITSPSIKNKTKTSTFQGFFKAGAVYSGVQLSGAISGNYSNEVIVDKMKPKEYPAYGYFNLQDGENNDEAALDFIREKDGQLHKDIRNLASPVLTYDIYSVSGHGFSGMFRPYRSDIGGIHDKSMWSSSDGVNVSLDASVGNLFQVGFSINFPTTDSKSGKWKGTAGNIYEKYNFTQFQNNSKHEPYRFQVYGESNVTDKSEISNLIGGFEPSYVAISSATGTDKLDYTTLSRLGNKSGQFKSITTNSLSQRSPRQTDIKAIENQFLYDTTLLPECKANFVIGTGTQIQSLDRTSSDVYKSHHIGAYIVTTTDGTRYIYALPVYNLKHVENSFSVKTSFETKDGLNQLTQSDFQKTSANDIVHNANGDDGPYGYENYEKTEIPAYVHTWLLTAIIGPDYVDLNEDGITDDDLGYFVKFTYKKSDETYNWRAPFTTANFIEGQHAIDADNMGTYNYGVRESFYLYRAETKSHVALFFTSNEREDARGAADEFQKGTTAVSRLGAKSYKLDSISLISKLELSKPIKKIYFEYNKYNEDDNSRFWVENNGNELCQNVENANHTTAKGTRGKLTLKALYTTYGENEKGLRNPYIFNYNEDNTTLDNPNYDPFKYDRWGNYQEPQEQDPENPNEMLPIKYFPYTRQDVDVNTKNKWASVWNLKEIVLPSAAKMVVDYEADRYAYVQNKPAMEMYKMQGINSTAENSGVEIFDLSIGNYASNENYVTFKLKRPITTENGAPETIAELKKYLDANGQLYYKLYIDLNGDDQWEFVTGYADIHAIELVNSTTAKIRLKNIDLKKGKNPQRSEHPFSLATWNYAQANRSELLNDNANGPLESRGRTGREVMNIINTFLSALNPLQGLSKFQSFYTRANIEGWGQRIDYDKSYIRLNSYLNQAENNVVEKFGGDSRVRSIKIYENQSSSEVVTGQFYDYTDSIPGTSLLISTGVAANEPSIGGDECALKTGKIGFLEPKFKTNYIQFSEMPMNESYMPAPDVGYSKVTVKSYATEKVLNQELAATVPTTGISIQEFFTARDYPTIFKETNLSQSEKTLLAKQPKLAFRPLGGTITESNLGATQGYYTEINDMHGKQKKVSYYSISHVGKIIPTPISYVEYQYKSNNEYDQNSNYKILNNEVPVIYNHLGTPQNKLVGVDVENFIDTRESESVSSSEGGRFNLSVIWCVFFPLPIPTFFPDLGYDQRRAYTCVNNKIIHKFGILEKTNVFKEGALTTTDNLVYDGYTGTPLLTSVNNEFNDTIFNYSLPAHLIYSGVGPSYPTNNLLFTGTVLDIDETTNQLAIQTPQWSVIRDNIQEGDELIVKDQFITAGINTNEEVEYDRCYVMKVDEAKKLIWVQASNAIAPGLSGEAALYVYRPYSRNMLNGTVGTIVSKNNPLRDKQEFDCK